MTTGSTNPGQAGTPLTHEQQRYLQTIFDYFHEKAEWPKRRYLERTLIKEDLDARKIGKSLVGCVGGPPHIISWNPDSDAQLTVPDMRLCRGADEELDAFIKALRLSVEKYVKADTNATPQLTSLDLMTRLSMSSTVTRKVGLMFQAEPANYSSFGLDGMGLWTMTLDHEVIRFRNVRSLDDYLAARWKPAEPAQVSGQMLPQAGSQRVEPDLAADAPPSRDVFVVHGHDEAAREATARFLESLGLLPIILHEQANAGLTTIEKFEKYASVAFAVVLLTPDDLGASKETPEPLHPRARQNVILELGYFLGRLGRNHVCALYKGEVELPSDMHGVLYVPMDEAGGWRSSLKRELKAVSMAVKE